MSELNLHITLEPTLILHNARIYTVDQTLPWAAAIAIRHGEIIAVGTNENIRALAGPSTELLDIQGRLVLPGLCDAHIHLYHWAINQSRPPLAAARSQEEMLKMIAAYAKTLPPTSWVVCQGWNESWWGQQDFFTATELDAIVQAGQPCIALRSDMHIAVANHAALTQANITASTRNPPGGVIDRAHDGTPTGVLREQAINLVTSQIAPPVHVELLKYTQRAIHNLHRLGITSIHDQRTKDGDDGPLMLAVYTALQSDQNLLLRVNCNIAAHQLDHLAALGLRSGFGSDNVRLGHVKVFADGSLGSRTAWMLAPFVRQSEDEGPNFGVNVTPPEQMAAEFRQAHHHGFPISVHAIGDRANRVVLDILEELYTQSPPPAIPDRIEHVQTIDPADMHRLGHLNITASVQPIHLVDDRELTDRFWGDRAAHTYAFESLREGGARLAFGSDAPVADPNPFLGIYAAFARTAATDDRPPWQPQEMLPLEAIISAYTLDAAEAAGWHTTIGSLTPGKRADLIVLDRDIFHLAADPDQDHAIAATKVEMTIFDGKLVYTRNE